MFNLSDFIDLEISETLENTLTNSDIYNFEVSATNSIIFVISILVGVLLGICFWRFFK